MLRMWVMLRGSVATLGKRERYNKSRRISNSLNGVSCAVVTDVLIIDCIVGDGVLLSVELSSIVKACC